MRLVNRLILGGYLVLAQSAFAHGPQPYPLIGVPIPPVPGLLDGSDPIVVNKSAAIALGKALFWDVSLGSDGMACGSCHFHAGADSRVKNQLNPGQKGSTASANTFEPMPGGTGGANYTLTTSDFPTYRYANPLSQAGGPTFTTDDVVSSSGTFSGTFTGATQFSGEDDSCNRSPDPVFHVNTTGTRRVEPRNAPTTYNTIFNYRNFWDGRANNIYNGSSPWGNRDPNAGVWVKVNARTVNKQRLSLINSSLASLAMGPPLNDAEMSCRQRTWPNVGRKLLLRQPLQYQKVHNQDSVLGAYSLSTAGNLKPGLNTTYKNLITKAFNQKYWSYSGTGPFGAPPGGLPYNQLEANFSMFFGLALQLYQGTLVSDQAPIDITPRNASSYAPTWAGMGYSQAKIDSINNGITQFTANHCNICHGGPTMTIATIVPNATLVTATTPTTYYGPNYAQRAFGSNALGPQGGAAAAGIMPHINEVTRDQTLWIQNFNPTNSLSYYKLMDFGFVNTGVNDPNADPGLGGVDDFGNPLSFSAQYVQYLLGNNAGILDPGITTVKSCDFIVEFAVNTTFPGDYFTSNDGIVADPNGNQNCNTGALNGWGSDSAYIPTTATAAANLNGPKMATAVQGAFKIPSLRNIELTGPYMHNGSMSTLEQVLEFYQRHGNFDNSNMHNLVVNIGLSGAPGQDPSIAAKNRADIIEFLKTLTDDRVRYEKAPFDHPEITIYNGHPGNQFLVDPGNELDPSLAVDSNEIVPAVGSNGRINPLLPFEAGLTP